ncbi:MAG: BON domain-containing protein [Pseudomonadota bacterium]
MNTKGPMIKFLLIGILSVSTLSGCMFAGSTEQSADGETIEPTRTFSTSLQDSSIRKNLVSKLKKEFTSKANDIHVTVYNRVVLLTGRVDSQESLDKAVLIASKTPHVRQIQSELSRGEPRTFLESMGDGWLSTSVSFRMSFTRNFPSNRVEDAVYEGTLYLLGEVTTAEEEQSIKIASKTLGANKVISLMEILQPTN